MADSNLLGEFLRARREQIRPDDVGVPDYGHRRVPGLRREELAMLAGLSADYYIRMEQGRARHPSVDVVDALARALSLEPDAAAHLHELARPVRRRRPTRIRPERIHPCLPRLLDQWSGTPAYVLGRHFDVLAANPLAAALHPRFRPPNNMLRTIFLDPDAREFYLDWEQAAHNAVAGVRAVVGAELDDPRLAELVGELSLRSEPFRRLWARHDVRGKSNAAKRLRHPLVGELELSYASFSVNAAPAQQLVVYFAEPASPSAEALALLASLTAGRPESAARPAGQPSRRSR